MPDAPSTQPGPSAGNAPAPDHLKWVNDPKLLANYLDKFNKQNPLHPGNAPKPVAEVFGSMKTPAENYSPPTGANGDAAKYWFNYMGYPDQYALNKVSKESGGNPNAYAAGSNAAGLGQVTPETARDVGFNFFKDNPNYPNQNNPKEPKQLLDESAWKTAMSDPNFGSLLGSMVSRKYYNMAKGDPFRAEAGYRNGFGKLLERERAGEPWPNPGYVKKMFPGQWNGQ